MHVCQYKTELGLGLRARACGAGNFKWLVFILERTSIHPFFILFFFFFSLYLSLNAERAPLLSDESQKNPLERTPQLNFKTFKVFIAGVAPLFLNMPFALAALPRVVNIAKVLSRQRWSHTFLLCFFADAAKSAHEWKVNHAAACSASPDGAPSVCSV